MLVPTLYGNNGFNGHCTDGIHTTITSLNIYFSLLPYGLNYLDVP